MSLQRGFEVEWCSHLPRNEYGDCDPDRATMEFKDFAKKADALRFAKKVLPKDEYGSVRVTEFEQVPYEPGCPATYREYIGDVEYVEA